MDAILPIAIWLTIILVVAGFVGIAAFGLRSVTYGKINPLSAIIIAAPVVLGVLLALIMGEWDRAAIWTAVIMFAVSLIGLAAYGARSVLGF